MHFSICFLLLFNLCYFIHFLPLYFILFSFRIIAKVTQTNLWNAIHNLNLSPILELANNYVSIKTKLISNIQMLPFAFLFTITNVIPHLNQKPKTSKEKKNVWKCKNKEKEKRKTKVESDILFLQDTRIWIILWGFKQNFICR